MRENVPWSDKG